MSPSEPALAPGTMIDHYRIIRPLGAGGMAEVYLARDTMLGRKVALKIIHPRCTNEEETTKRFLFEAKATARFNHPNIITIHNVGMTADRPYLALEYLEGQTLRERLDQERLSVKESIRIARSITDALCAAHDKDLLHRDLKPDNIILGQDGRLRVLDFGLSRLIGTQEQFDLDNQDVALHKTSVFSDTMITKQHTVCGTPAYMSPEQWKSEEIGPATDMWALGLILYEMLFGRHPYDDILSMRSLASQVSGSDPVPRPASHGRISLELRTLVESCLAKDASERPTAKEGFQQLDRQITGNQHQELENICPFRGLLNFEEEHSPLYFGREAEVAAFVEKLRYEPILPVIGPSGAGKSSFVKAGVVPRLREKGPLILVQTRPGRDPFLSLASSLVSALRLPKHTTDSLGPMGSLIGLQKSKTNKAETIEQPKELAQELFDRPHQLGLRLHRLAEQHRTYVVLFVDQLEELCALQEEEESLPLSSEKSEREPSSGTLGRFMQAIAGAADDPHLPVRVILTMREEFLTRLMTSNQVREALNRIMVLRKPSQKTLIDILERTVRAVGYTFEEFHLAYELVEDVQGAHTCFPLLQFAGQVMWQNRDEQRQVLTNKSYQDMGGVTGALVQHAEGVLKSLTSEEAELAKRIFLRLVTEDKTRRIMSHKDLLVGMPEEAQNVLSRLVESRLVSISREKEGEEGECELVHEALITNWKRLNNWIDENREELGLLSQLQQSANLWSKRGKLSDDLLRGKALKEANGLIGKVDLQDPDLFFLHESNKANKRKRISYVALIVLLVMIISSAFAIGNHYQTRQECDDFDQLLIGVWDKPNKESVRTAFFKTGLPYAKDTWNRVETEFDQYLADWTHMQAELCQSTWLGIHSDEFFSLKMRCFRTRLDEFRKLVKIFSEANNKVVERAIRASTGLSSLKHCINEEALTSRLELPHERIVNQVEVLQKKLVTVKVLLDAGKYTEGSSLAQEVRIQSEKLDYRPLTAEALYWAGLSEEELGKYEIAQGLLQQAYWEAVEATHLEIMTRASTHLAWTVGYRLTRVEEGLFWGRTANTALTLLKRPPELESTWYDRMGSVYSSQDEEDKAIQFHQKALQIDKRMLDADHPALAHGFNNIGVVYWRREEYHKALEYYTQALLINRKAYGLNHPELAHNLNNIGLVYWRLGEFEKASKHLHRALVIWEESLGREHPVLTWALSGLAEVHRAEKKLTEAQEKYQRVAEICKKQVCYPEPEGMALFGLAKVNWDLHQDRQQSLALAQKARQVYAKVPKFKREIEAIDSWIAKLSQ